MKGIRFLPWIGNNYEQGINGKKIVVLGESHYCANIEKDATPQITIKVISDLLDPDSEHEGYKNTYTKFERALAGKRLDYSEKITLWHSIIFYNYVQEAFSGPRKMPTFEQYANAENAFFELLEQYRPDCVIVWGKRLYNNLPRKGEQGYDIVISGTDSIETWEYTLNDGKVIKLLPIVHPSAGFSWDYWHQVIVTFLN